MGLCTGMGVVYRDAGCVGCFMRCPVLSCANVPRLGYPPLNGTHPVNSQMGYLIMRFCPPHCAPLLLFWLGWCAAQCCSLMGPLSPDLFSNCMAYTIADGTKPLCVVLALILCVCLFCFTLRSSFAEAGGVTHLSHLPVQMRGGIG